MSLYGHSHSSSKVHTSPKWFTIDFYVANGEAGFSNTVHLLKVT